MDQRYAQTLDYLYRQLPMYHRVGAAAYKKDLGNTLALCAHLGDPHRQFPTIHVGGTNGKGSVSHMLAAICQQADLKTGLYISPHYKDFRERIKINGTYIPRRAVVDFVERLKPAIETIQPSFFELCVAMAFEHFAREKVDIAIVEVGLGGRLDSTNVIAPLLSVITNISYDHMAMLGDTLPQIAFEKAGIIKQNTPVVIGETHPESAPVFLEKAKEMAAPIVFADQHFSCEPLAQTAPDWATGLLDDNSAYRVSKDGQPLYDTLRVQAAGGYQAKNAATVLQAIETLKTTVLPSPALPERLREQLSKACEADNVSYALAQLRTLTRFMGRWQRLGDRPIVLCDSAHNEAGLQEAFGRIQAAEPLYRRLHIVTGFVNDKDLGKALAVFPQNAHYYFAKANIPRGMDAALLRQEAQAYGLIGRPYTSVRNALKAAKRAAAPEDLILVIGSIFVVAEII